MAVPAPYQSRPPSESLPIGLLGLVVLFIGGITLGTALFDGPWSSAWIPVTLTGASLVVAAVGAWFMWYGFSKVLPA